MGYCGPPKPWYLVAKLHDVTMQQITNTSTSVETFVDFSILHTQCAYLFVTSAFCPHSVPISL